MQCAYCKDELLEGATVCRSCARKQPPTAEQAGNRRQMIVVLFVVGVAVLFVISLIGWSMFHNPAVDAAEQAVRAKLDDPDSAVFSDERVTATGTVCGRVNSKNRWGAYGDPVRFYVEPDDIKRSLEGAAAIESPGSPYWEIFDRGWTVAGC